MTIYQVIFRQNTTGLAERKSPLYNKIRIYLFWILLWNDIKKTRVSVCKALPKHEDIISYFCKGMYVLILHTHIHTHANNVYLWPGTYIIIQDAGNDDPCDPCDPWEPAARLAGPELDPRHNNYPVIETKLGRWQGRNQWSGRRGRGGRGANKYMRADYCPLIPSRPRLCRAYFRDEASSRDDYDRPAVVSVSLR